MVPTPFDKPHADTPTILDHLEDKGLVIDDRDAASCVVEHLGYAHLRYYLLSRRDQPGRRFRSGTTFEDIAILSETDAKIRDACWPSLRKFEMDFRCMVSETLSERFGSHAHYDDDAFANPDNKQDALEKIKRAVRQVENDDPRIMHYSQTYSSPKQPPIWTVKEISSFGTIRTLYQKLNVEIMTHIAKKYVRLPNIQLFLSWIRNLVIMRNMCAHHQMLFKSRFKMQPQVRRSVARIPTAHPRTLKAQLECLDEMLAARGIASNIVADVGKIIDACPTMEMREAGY